MSVKLTQRNALFLTSIASACMLAACGGNDNGSASPAATAQTQTYGGVVTSSAYVPGSTTGDPTIKAGYYTGATVFVDTNGNGKLDSGEPSAKTDSNGHFTLQTSGSGQLVADIPTSAKNTASGAAVTSHMILRASVAQIADQGASNVVISPMSSEVQRLVEANGSTYATEKTNVANRLTGPAFGASASAVTVSGADALGDVNRLSGTEQQVVLFEENQLASRYTYATTKLDRADLYPDNLAVLGGDPALPPLAGQVTAATAVTPAQTQAPITFAQAQQAAFNVEGIPRYDNIFIIMMENKSTNSILGSQYAPNINNLLTTGSQFTTYYATGNPSEPNYTALGGADDWGITDDSWWGCGAGAPGTGANNAPTDVAFAGGKASDGQPLVATQTTPPLDSAHLSSYGNASCNIGSVANHNVSAPSLFTLISQAGMTWRTYSESMNPGQDPRADSIADTAVTGTFTGAGGPGTANYAVPGGLYKTKHHPGMAYQSTRNLPEFFADNRTVAGTQWDATAWSKSTAYPIPAGYDYDQLGTDLATGDVGNLNFIMPDQCDDMHSVGSDTSCKGNPIIQRGDAYVQQLVTRIESSPLWANRQRKVAIVVMFDEGGGTSTSCCGWNTSKTSGDQPLQQDSTGKWIKTASPLLNYSNGNFGHGNSIFGVLTNQQNGTGVVDSDAYSHFSFVRTLQDMFQIGDPGNDASYLSRAKYTERFIAQNIANLPEFLGSADTHFDSVRPMNHAYVIPTSYTQKLNPGDVSGTSLATAQVGPDKTQANVWAVSK
ncbi:alkaline phosphatase family protein [Paraburkholderia diazotrophica]|uniref:Phosphoesterase family protein n=1 Tax=Paraburkholderia diazotrophica TaxID=667676 RepID=A0A1H6YIL4_9BURK|nr:alkaline phosphatase family protein [Paraburkholderia diazotrophica]SEJ41148.1 Phosphoesterase family protein [Paraburkholderia diazotrophica]